MALRLLRAATGSGDIARRAQRLPRVDHRHRRDLDLDWPTTRAAAETRPPWVHVVESPNAYRGPYRGAGRRRGLRRRRRPGDWRGCRPSGGRIGGFIAEPVYGNAGGVLLPDGYLQQVYASVRAAGGLCIADEVQVGYGRLGDYFWGFEQQGVVPDIVTMAKCTGNGIPVGAVVTTRAIAEQLRRGGFVLQLDGRVTPSAARRHWQRSTPSSQKGLQANAARIGRRIADRRRGAGG